MNYSIHIELGNYLNLDEAVEKGYTSYERADLAQKLLEAKQKQSELKIALNAANQEVCKIATEFNKTGQKESKREFF